MNPEQVSTAKKRWADSRKIAKHALCSSAEIFAIWGKLRDLGMLKRARDGEAKVIEAIINHLHGESLARPLDTSAIPSDEPTLADYRAVITFVKTVGGFKRAAYVMPRFAEFFNDIKELE